MKIKFKEKLFPKKEEIFSWICDLSQWGHRKTGSEEGRKSAEYIASKLMNLDLRISKSRRFPQCF